MPMAGFIAADLDDLVTIRKRIAMGKRAEQLLDIGRADGPARSFVVPSLVAARLGRRPPPRTRRLTIASAFSHFAETAAPENPPPLHARRNIRDDPAAAPPSFAPVPIERWVGRLPT